MDGWPLALEQAETAAWLVREIPDGAGALFDGMGQLFKEADAPVPLWVGLARERFPVWHKRMIERRNLKALIQAGEEAEARRVATLARCRAEAPLFSFWPLPHYLPLCPIPLEKP